MKLVTLFIVILLGVHVSSAQATFEIDDAISVDSLNARKAINRDQLKTDLMNYCKNHKDDAVRDFFSVFKEEHPETTMDQDPGAFDKINFSVDQFDAKFVKHHLKFPTAGIIVHIAKSENKYRVDDVLGRLFYVELLFRLSNTGKILGHQERLVFFNKNKSKDKSTVLSLDKGSKKRSVYYRK